MIERGASAAVSPVPQARRGMTLIEILVVLFIVSGLVGGSLYVAAVLTHASLKEEAMRFVSTAQYTYDQAALNSRQYRLVIDLDTNEYYTEVTEAELMMDQDSEQVEAAYDDGLLPEEARDPTGGSGDDNDLFREEGHDPFGVSRRTGYQSAEDRLVEPRSLDEGIEFERVLTETNTRPVQEGQAAIHFFPNGMQQQAYVVLRDTSSDARFTLITEPLTGRIHVHSGEEAVPDDFGEEEVDEGF